MTHPDSPDTERRSSPESTAGSFGVVQVALVDVIVAAVSRLAHGLKELNLQEPAQEVSARIHERIVCQNIMLMTSIYGRFDSRHVGRIVRDVKLGQGVELVFAPESAVSGYFIKLHL